METEGKKAARAPSAGVGSVVHAIEILRCISDAPNPIGINELARRVGLHKSSVSRLVATLHRANLLRRDETTGRFGVGFGLLGLAAPLQMRLSLNDIIEPAVTELARGSEETASFNIWDGACGVSVLHVSGGSSVQVFSAPGKRKPAYASATGKILLAYQPAPVIQQCCKTPWVRFTDATFTEPKQLLEELKRSKERGYATNFGEFESEVGGIAAPVFSPTGEAIGCVALTVPIYRLSEERSRELGMMLVDCGKQITKNLLLIPNFSFQKT